MLSQMTLVNDSTSPKKGNSSLSPSVCRVYKFTAINSCQPDFSRRENSITGEMLSEIWMGMNLACHISVCLMKRNIHGRAKLKHETDYLSEIM